MRITASDIEWHGCVDLPTEVVYDDYNADHIALYRGNGSDRQLLQSIIRVHLCKLFKCVVDNFNFDIELFTCDLLPYNALVTDMHN